METIRNYLDNIFASLPKTAETAKLRDELLANMTDKYTELKASGKTENEAVGTVIAEFGNIEELAAELNITVPKADSSVMVDQNEVSRFLVAKKYSSLLKASGVSLILFGLAALVFSSLYIMGPPLSVLFLLVFVAIAVALFIFSGYKREPFRYLENNFHLTPSAENLVQSIKEKAQHKRMLGNIIGIMLCILAPAVLIMFTYLSGIITIAESDMRYNQYGSIGFCLFLLVVGAGIFLLITSSAESNACDQLLQMGDFAPHAKKNNMLIGAIGSVWWPVSVIIFLLIGFLSPRGFGIAWIIWPVSGILFGAVSSLVSILQSNNKK